MAPIYSRISKYLVQSTTSHRTTGCGVRTIPPLERTNCDSARRSPRPAARDTVRVSSPCAVLQSTQRALAAHQQSMSINAGREPQQRYGLLPAPGWESAALLSPGVPTASMNCLYLTCPPKSQPVRSTNRLANVSVSLEVR